MYCNYCGKVISDDSNLCAYCGKRVGGVIARKKLVRPRQGRKIAGVCLGFAEYFDLDVSLVRIVWAITVLFGMFGGGGLRRSVDRAARRASDAGGTGRTTGSGRKHLGANRSSHPEGWLVFFNAAKRYFLLAIKARACSSILCACALLAPCGSFCR